MAEGCVRCGRCLAVCPVYRLKREEAVSARGRLALIDAHDQGRLDQDRAFRRALTACLLCGACERTCTNGVQVRRAVIRGRTGLAGGLKRMALAVTANPQRTARAVKTAAAAGRLARRWLNLPPDSGLHIRYPSGRAVAPPLAERPLTELFPSPVGPSDGERVILFPGCLTNFALPGVGLAAVESLTAAGYRVMIPAEAGCCGLPAQAAGLVRLADRRSDAVAGALRRARRLFARPGEPVAAIVFVCATCQRRLNEEFERLWPDHPPLIDLAQALDGRLPQLVERVERVTFHDPCHSLDPGSDAPAAARRLLARLPGLELIESNADPTCCGSGGLFSLSHPQASAAIGRIKAEALAASRAGVVATSCPACLLRLKEIGQPLNMKAVHLAELTAERLKSD